MSKQLIKRQKGFTIIEVMIVLAIAALILLAVFLAVPALQRSSRNTQRKTDVSAVLGGISEYQSNNNGAMPTNAAFASPTLTLCNNNNCTTKTDAQSQVKLGYYTGYSAAPSSGNVTVYTAYTAPPAAAADEMIVEEKATCTGTGTAAAGSARSIAIIYGIEATGTTQWQCTSS